MTLASLVRRLPARSAGAGLLSVALALGVGALLILVAGRSPVLAYAALFQASLGSLNGLAETAVRTVPLALCGLGVALAFRVGVFNVGAEGQLLVGGTAAAFVGVELAGGHAAVVLPAMAVAAAAAGLAWSGIAAALKLRRGADELITTIMLNYVAIALVGYLLHGPLQDPGSPLAQTARLGPEGRLPVVWPGTRLHAGILLAVLAALAAHVILWWSVVGFRLRALGLNPDAARTAGFRVGRLTWIGFAACGALAGLAGFAEVAGVHRRMIENLSPGFGYTAIIVALLGGTNPLGVLAAAALIAALQVGATTMESAAGVPGALSTVVQALVVLGLIGQAAWPSWRRPRPAPGPAAGGS